MALVRTEAVSEFADVVAQRYHAATGYTPNIYLCNATDGAALVPVPEGTT